MSANIEQMETLETQARRLIENEVMTGLAQDPKRISPKYFYDQKGSSLFDAITDQEEYYVPRVEKEIYREYKAAICETIGKGVSLIEPGAGSCEKIRWLLPELEPVVYVPMDISAEHLQQSATALSNEFANLKVQPQVCDHTQGLVFNDLSPAPPVFFYPGSSVGNYEPEEAVELLSDMRAKMDTEGGLLIGVDTKKDEAVLHAAYNDSEGVTAEFNVNVLHNLNNLLDGNLDSSKFEHLALYNSTVGRIEMHLRCKEDHAADLAGQVIEFSKDELVHTENSYKYHPEEFIGLAEQAGFAIKELWQDQRNWFSVMYFSPV
ncbi:MAG: L-histidine N(alpha)-methyltransferase [Gammaproteobacteria bacterium]